MDKDLLLKELDKLSFTELVVLYIEAKTWDTGSIDELFSPEIVDLINNLSEAIKLPDELK